MNAYIQYKTLSATMPTYQERMAYLHKVLAAQVLNTKLSLV